MMRASLLLYVGAAPWRALAGCRGQTSKDSPIVGIRGMYDQPRYDMQSKSAFFADHRTMRLPVEGTIAREEIVGHRRSTRGASATTAATSSPIPQPRRRARRRGAVAREPRPGALQHLLHPVPRRDGERTRDGGEARDARPSDVPPGPDPAHARTGRYSRPSRTASATCRRTGSRSRSTTAGRSSPTSARCN